MSDPLRELLDEQIAYYRARAEEYDRTSTPVGDPYAPHADRVRAELQALDLRGRVIEIAAGTGQWTGFLADTADELTALDSAPEMLALNRARTARTRVRHVVGDALALVDEGRHEDWHEDWIDEPRAIVRRTLLDGTVHRAVKVLWNGDDLAARLSTLGWNASVTPCGPFYWGVVRR